jgi:hypothetical protein
VDLFKTPSKFAHLPVTAYPGINIVNISQSELGAAFPVNVFRVFFGAVFSDQLALSISVPSAVDVELPAVDAYQVIGNFCSAKSTRDLCSSTSYEIGWLSKTVRRPPLPNPNPVRNTKGPSD